RLRRLAHEVEDAVGLLAEGDRIRLECVDHVGELDRVADEEDRQVVADQVPVAVLGVELHREAARVARHLGGVAAPDHGGEADRQRRLLARLGEDLRPGVLRGGLVADLPRRLELAVAGEAARMDHPFGDALAVEVADLLQELVVLQRRRAAAADGALRLVVADRMALAVGQRAVPASMLVVAAHGMRPRWNGQASVRHAACTHWQAAPLRRDEACGTTTGKRRPWLPVRLSGPAGRTPPILLPWPRIP